MKTSIFAWVCAMLFCLPHFLSGQTNGKPPSSKTPAQKTSTKNNPAPIKKQTTAAKPAPVKTETADKRLPPPKVNKGLNLEYFSMDLAPGLFFPIGSAKLSTKISPMLQYHLWYNFKHRWALGFETGIYQLNRKRTDAKAGHVIPYIITGKYKTIGRLMAELGAGMIRDEGKSSPSPFFPGGKSYVIKRFAYRAGLGLQLSPTAGIHLRYEGARTNSWISLSAAFTFVNKENNDRR